jgi:RHS repeat-associated protein
MGLTVMGFAFLNPLLSTSAETQQINAAEPELAVAVSPSQPADEARDTLPPVLTPVPAESGPGETETNPGETAIHMPSGNDFVERPYDDLADADNLLFMPSKVRPPMGSPGLSSPAVGGAGGADSSGGRVTGPPSSGVAGPQGAQLPSASGPSGAPPNTSNAPPAPKATELPQPEASNGSPAKPAPAPGASGAITPGKVTVISTATPTTTSSGGSGAAGGIATNHKSGLLPPASDSATVGIVDDYAGVVLSSNVPQNDFSTYSVQLDAELIDPLATTPESATYSWDTSGASDATSVTGSTTYRLNLAWASFTGAARTDTISLDCTLDGTVEVAKTVTFKVAGTDSPAYTATQPTTPSTWLSLLPPDAVDSNQTMAGGQNYQVGLTEGSLQLTHALPGYNPNVPPVQLGFNSAAMIPQPIFVVHYQLNPSASVAGSLTARLTFNGTAGAAAGVGTNIFFPGDTMQIAEQANAATLATGRYSYTFQIVDANAASVTTTYTGSADVVNYKDNAFGAGWSLSGLERVYSVTGGVLLDLGDGTSLWFANGGTAGTFVTPTGDFSTLTKNTLSGVYTRSMPDGTAYHYDSSGYETSLVDRNSNTTTYNYDGSHNLTSITDFNNQITSFAYNGSSQVTSITDPASRITTLAYASSNRLTSIKDPNGSLWSYSYDASSPSHLQVLTDPNGAATTFTYTTTARGRISKVTHPDLSQETYSPAQLQGWVDSSLVPGRGTPGNGILINQGLSKTTDANGNNTTAFLDWTGFGAQTENIDALGETTITHRDTNGLGWMNADGLGNRTRAFFDGSGNVTKQVNGDDSTTQYTYNGFNEVSQTTDGLGHLSTATYDANGNMTQMKDSLGNLTSYTYTSKGLVSTSKDSLNHVVTYSYNSLNRMTQTQDALGNLTTSLYDNASNLTTSIDARGNRTTYSLDALGRTTQAQDALGNLTTSLYDSANNLTTSIDARGDRTTYSFDGQHRRTQVQDALGGLTTNIFDASGNLTTSIDALGHRTTYSLDAANRQTQMQDALGNLTSTVYDSASRVTTSIDARGDRTTYSFDANGRQTSVKDALGHLSTSMYDSAGNLTTSIDALGRRTSYTFDARNRPTQVQNPLGGLTTNIFDNAGNLTTSVDQLSHRTTYSFDALNRQTQVQDSTGALTTNIFDVAGNVTTSIDARNLRTTFSFDGLNRETQVQDALGNLSTVAFDQAGNRTASIDQLGNRSTYMYDALNRQTSVTDANNHTVTTMYDLAGNVTSSIDAGGFRVTTSYDALNRQTSVKDPASGVTTTVYDSGGNVTNTIDSMGSKTTFVFDALDQQTTVIDARGGLTTLVFDAVGNQTNVIDPVSNKTTFAFDALNRQTSMTDPLGNSGTMAYDAASREISATDRNGRLISFSYDNVGRETGETWTVSGSTVNTFTFTFDAAGNLLTAANAAGTYTMAYDNLNRATAVQEPFGLSLTYAFDKAGRQTTTQDNQSGVTSSVYDGIGQLTTREFGGSGMTPLREDLTYTSRNQMGTATRYSDLAGTTLVGTSSYSYDSVDNVTNIQHAGKTGTNLANYTYVYDLASRITSETDNASNTTYTYDATSELTGAGGTLYTYDLNGNRTMAGYTTGTNNQLMNDGTWTYTYDNEGNLTKKSKGASAETWFFSYDNKNHMTGVKQEATDGGTVQMQATYVYDALQNRVEKDVWTSGGGGTLTTTRFGYDRGNVWADLNGSNVVQMRRLYLQGIDQVFARIDSGGSAAWYLTDHVGSIREVINSANTTTDVVSYDAWGGVTSESNSAYGDRYKNTGRELDSETGLQYNRSRLYLSGIARWISQDPLGFSANDANLYRYVLNNPLAYTDPFGTKGSKKVIVDVGIYLDGTWDKPQDNTIIWRMFSSSWHLKFFYFMVRGRNVRVRALAANVVSFVSGIEAQARLDKNPVVVYLSGYSRGAIIAAAAANILTSPGEFPLGDVSTAFVGMLDPVKTGTIGAQGRLSQGVDFAWEANRDKRFNPAIPPYIIRISSGNGPCQPTIDLSQPGTVELNHHDMGQDPVLEAELREAESAAF